MKPTYEALGMSLTSVDDDQLAIDVAAIGGKRILIAVSDETLLGFLGLAAKALQQRQEQAPDRSDQSKE